MKNSLRGKKKYISGKFLGEHSFVAHHQLRQFVNIVFGFFKHVESDDRGDIVRSIRLQPEWRRKSVYGLGYCQRRRTAR